MKKQEITRNLLCLSAIIGLCQFGVPLLAAEEVAFPAGKFETISIPYGWQKWPRETSASLEIINEGRGGSKAGHFTGDSKSKDASLYTYIQLQANTKYKITGYARSSKLSASFANVSVGIHFQKAKAHFSVKLPDTMDTKGEWVSFELSFTSPVEAVDAAQFVISMNSVEGSFDLDDISITKE